MAAPDPADFTRGAPGAADLRGASMVAKHAEARAAKQEADALAALRASFPTLPPALLAAAAAEVGFSAPAASPLVEAFWAQHGEDVRSLFAAAGVALQAPPPPPSGGDGDANDDDDRRRKRCRRRSRSRSRDRHRRRSRSRDRRRRRSRSRDRRASPAATAADRYGKYGTIHADADADAKRSEFCAWVAEVKKCDLETLSRPAEADLWRTFVEDYNTATLPSRKYYDLAAWTAKQKKGGVVEKRAVDDETALRAERAAERAAAAAERLRDAYDDLKREGGAKASDMREQEVLRRALATARRVGDDEKAAALAKRLAPDKK